ncbi:hypothetical protein GCM10009087_20490 [Sphingomonas oligophenolica]
MHEHILAAIIANDEAEALLAVEEFDDARALANDLGRHAATTAASAGSTAEAAAAAETAAAAAAEAITAAAAESVTTATEAIAATAEAVTTAKAAVETAFTAETVTLVAPTPAAIPAASFIETHALFVFPARPNRHINTPALDEKRGCSNAKPIASPSRCSVIPLSLRINSSEIRQDQSNR